MRTTNDRKEKNNVGTVVDHPRRKQRISEVKFKLTDAIARLGILEAFRDMPEHEKAELWQKAYVHEVETPNAGIELLPIREAQILRARYLTENPKRLRELSEELGVTTGRIHQLEQQAISRLRDGTVVLTDIGLEEARRLLSEKWGSRKVA